MSSLKPLSSRVYARLEPALRFLARSLLSIYRAILSVHIGGGCRFHPSCSEYAIQAFDNYDFLTAFKLTTKRLSKCHPLGASGIDPVPTPEELK